jgi:formate hydrogenlyase subunit 3/multisubunit Na+/H+ antiporter MnhD subunit
MIDPANPLQLMAVVIALFGGSFVIAVLLQRRGLTLIYPLCIAASVLGAATALEVLLTGSLTTGQLPLGLPTIGLRFRLDALSAFFGLVVNIGMLAASLYGLGLHRHGELSLRVEPFFPVFGAAMNMVLLADDAFSFLFFWELMSVTSWALVR